jgi:sigma-E factor negative regulatory protein RseA
MTDKLNEQLSALMDDECATPELGLALRRLSGDAELKACWQRYHLMGDTLRNNLPQIIETEFCDRVHHLIAAEPPLNQPTRRDRRHFRPLAGWAVAASISVAVGAGVVTMWSPADSSSASAQLADESHRSTIPIIESEPAPEVRQVVTVDEFPVTPTSDSRLSNYLIDHNEYASFNSIRGIVPYMHMVTYNNNNLQQ